MANPAPTGTSPFRREAHKVDLCVVGGANNAETGIIEEILLDNLHRNPLQGFSIWDSILYEKVRFEPNITLLLNCSCLDAAMAGARIRSATGWQLTTQTWQTVEAGLFADCSGDSVLAPLVGAEFRMGREARREFGESIEPEESDRRTMGMSCLIQAREPDRPQPFIPPSWAHPYRTDEDLPRRDHGVCDGNFWWLELGGEQDCIHDTEAVRDELLKAAFGVWDHIKNHGDYGAENWALDWVGFLPGKRESRRCLGDHLLTQNDVRAGARFDDLVAYGGWPMDDHHPGGLRWRDWPNIFHPAPSPYGIPYRCLYSRNVANLFFAGRNISVTHAALSSTRVMATCAILGQAVGTAAALAAQEGLLPRGLGEKRIGDLQQALMSDDCHIPWRSRSVSGLAKSARLTASAGDPEPLRNGVDRPVGEQDNGWAGDVGSSWLQYEFDAPAAVGRQRFVFDSDLNRNGPDAHRRNIPCCFPLRPEPRTLPPTLTRAFRIEARDSDGSWRTLARVQESHQRLVQLETNVRAAAIRFVPEATWGAERAHLFAWDVE